MLQDHIKYKTQPWNTEEFEEVSQMCQQQHKVWNKTESSRVIYTKSYQLLSAQTFLGSL